MKLIFIRLGILMSLLTVISGLWEQYDLVFLLLKTIAVFFISIGAAFSLHFFFRKIVPLNDQPSHDELA